MFDPVHSPSSVASRASRHGACLADGEAHAHDHRVWSRRSFLGVSGRAILGASLLLGRTPVQAYRSLPVVEALRGVETDRVLVLIQLGGGNDGLNTVVPYRNDRYYQLRPTLALQPSELVTLDDAYGLHDALTPWREVWDRGHLSVVHGVGYPDPNLSHFEMTDLWLRAGEIDPWGGTGWIGRHYDFECPDFSESPPEHPLAVQLGATLPLLFQGPDANMGMTVSNPELFARIAEQGVIYPTDGLPPTPAGQETAFVRDVANESFRYAGAIQEATTAGRNVVDYPAGNPLANNLANVARLIKGGLRTGVYLVSLNGFDTHANQRGTHAFLLDRLAAATRAFLDDLEADGYGDRALCMTVSEFGRRPGENGSAGCDHGTAAPLFVMGSGALGGLFGAHPSLTDLDQAGNVAHTTDFRAVYATVLRDWFGVADEAVAGVLGEAYPSLGFVADPQTPTPIDDTPAPGTFALEPNYPNPFTTRTTIAFRLERPGPVRLDVFDVRGRRVTRLIDATLGAGRHEQTLVRDAIPAGTYLVRLTTPDGAATRTITAVP